jgi:membrane protein YqaA with SNARE-associated domain
MPDTNRPDDISVVRWFLFYGAGWGVAVTLLASLAGGAEWTWSYKPEVIGRNIAQLDNTVKMLAFFIYVSMACQFFPLPTNPVVAAVALRQVAVTDELWSTALIVAAVGGLASTIANMHDYHLYTLVLRSKRIARIRQTKLYEKTAGWFHKSPFTIMVVSSFLPLPIDVIRLLAVTYRYPRLPYALGNFIGRFLRYAVIAGLTFALGDRYGWIVPAALLGLAVVMVAGKAGAHAMAKYRSESNV